MNVDPDNRMVADTLEADWNAKLRALADAQDRCERHRQAEGSLDEEQRARILALATDFLVCGTIHVRQFASASEWHGCSSRM